VPSSATSTSTAAVPEPASFPDECTVYGDDPAAFAKVDECDGEALRLDSYQQYTASPVQLYSFSGQSTAVYSSPTMINGYPPDLSDPPSDATIAPSSSYYTGGTSSLDYPFASRVTSVSYSSTPKSSVDSMSYAIDANMPAASSDYSIDATAYGSISDFGTCFPPPSFPNSGSSTSILPAMEDYSDFDDTTDASATVAATAAVSATSSSSHTVRRRNTYTAMPTSLAPYAEEPLASTRTRAGTMLTGSSAAVRLTEAMPISNTLAAIKAQAFGGVRKTRARVKRVPTSSDAARAAVEILEARGIGLGLDIAGGVKRRKRGDHP